MNHPELLQSFGKGKPTTTVKKTSSNSVIYTRVSSKEQADNNQSLETQKKYCLQYALKQDLEVLGFFGGTYESAKTDERKEFNRMIRFVKNQKEGVSFILVYSLDRFSRTGDNAIFISSELKKRGISIISVTQPIDVSTHSGVLQQNIQFIFSKYDNDLRREKCIDGMKEKLLRGECIGKLPVGYCYNPSHGFKNYSVSIDDRGKFIAQGYAMKVQGFNNTEIADKLSRVGFKVNRKRVSEILSNPFYCGYISASILEGQLVQGKHEPLVSEEVFLEANDIIKSRSLGARNRTSEMNSHVPLKNYVRCSECGTPFTGYIVKKKNLYYYKCNKIGCKCNRSAKAMHQLFRDFIKSYQIDSSLTGLLKEQLLYTYEYITGADKDLNKETQRRVSELQIKLGTLEERYAFGEIESDVYNRVSEKLKKEIKTLKAELKACENELSNPELFIDRSLKICSNLAELWDSSKYSQRLQLQELLFPEGILYDKQIGNYRTTRVNSVIELTRTISEDWKENKKRTSHFSCNLSDSVVPTGIEPVLPE